MREAGVSPGLSGHTTGKMECPVCFCDNATLKFVCGHAFCRSCTKQWLTKSKEEGKPGCPMCRTPILFKGLRKINKDSAEKRIGLAYEELYGEMFDEALEQHMDWVDLIEKMCRPGKHSRTTLMTCFLRDMTDLDQTFKVMTEVDKWDPDTIWEYIMEDELFLNSKKEAQRDRRAKWSCRDKFADKNLRTRVMKNGR